MTALLQAELLKIRLTRSSYWWFAAAIALVAFAIGMTLALGTVRNRFDELSLLSFSGSGGLMVLLLGVALGAGEYRHRTVIATLLFEPRRARVWVNQAIACAVVGVLLGAVCCIVASVIVFPWLSAKGTPVLVSNGRLLADFGGSIAYCGISAVIGSRLGPWPATRCSLSRSSSSRSRSSIQRFRPSHPKRVSSAERDRDRDDRRRGLDQRTVRSGPQPACRDCGLGRHRPRARGGGILAVQASGLDMNAALRSSVGRV